MADELKAYYTALAKKEAAMIEMTRDIEALTRLIKTQVRQLNDLIVKREKTRKEIVQLSAGLQLILKANE